MIYIMKGVILMKDNFKYTCVFATCSAITVALIGMSALSFAKTVYANPTSSTINVEVDSNLYNGLVALADTDSSFSKADKSAIENLNVYINGKSYPVTENADGQLIVENVEVQSNTDDTETDFTEIESIDIPLSSIESSKVTVDANGNRIYHIVWGDTLSELALEFDSTVNELATLNHIPNVDLIYAGNDMYLPK